MVRPPPGGGSVIAVDLSAVYVVGVLLLVTVWALVLLVIVAAIVWGER